MAAESGEGLRLFCLANVFRQHPGEVTNNVAHVVHLALPRDMTRDSAGVLDVLVTVENLPDCGGLIAHRIPQVDRKDQGVLSWIVIKNYFGRCFVLDHSVPITMQV